jgi:C4-dicarboxylate-specific signal transduction histidine kinase
VPEALPSTLHLDGRQLRKWRVVRGRVPDGAVVHFETPGFFETYWRESMAGGLVIAAQAALIGLLMAERRRRRSAELARQTLRTELMHASRLAVAGELVASIAHEINQPLGAIQANADAAELILASGADRREDLRAILADIRRDDQRASEVIRRLRALLAKREVEKRSFDLEEAVRDVERLLSPEARRRGVSLELRLPGGHLEVHGDRIQLQQVVINLALNAMDALAARPEARRRVEVSLAREPGQIVLLVRDQGPGISAEHLPKLFDSFFTTKSGGMGLGLAIARTIVEAHGGRIRAENAPGGGAAFFVELPLPGRDEAPPERP